VSESPLTLNQLGTVIDQPKWPFRLLTMTMGPVLGFRLVIPMADADK
jgi:hypothetical protein